VDASGELDHLAVCGGRGAVENHHRLAGGEVELGRLGGRRHAGVEGLGDGVGLEALKGENGEAAAEARGTSAGVDEASAFNVLDPVVAGQRVGGRVALLDQAGALVDLGAG
jgi:hypothetical protein